MIFDFFGNQLKMNTQNIIFIAIHDGHYDIGFYFPESNDQTITVIKNGAPFTYQYNGITFELFKDYARESYSITDIYSFKQHISNLKDHYYKFDYEELCYLAIRNLFDISLNTYKKYQPHDNTIPTFKITISDAFKEIQYDNKNIYVYFTIAIYQNMSMFKINNLTLNLASEVYQYYLYYANLFDISKISDFNPKFNHLVFEFGYSTTACYIYEFTSEVKKINIPTQIQLSKTDRNVLTSCKLKSVNIYNFGLFDFISSIYLDFMKTDGGDFQNINSQYEYPIELENHLKDYFKYISYYNQSSVSSVYFENLNDDKIKICKTDLCDTIILNRIKEQISTLINTFNVKTYMIDSPVNVSWLIEDVSNMKYIELNGTSGISNLANSYKMLITNNLIYQIIALTKIPEDFEKNIHETDYLDKPGKRYGRKLNILYPDLHIENTGESSLKTKSEIYLNTHQNELLECNKMCDYIIELNEKNQKLLSEKNKFQTYTKKRLIEKGYPVSKINTALAKISMLSLNDPIIFKRYINDFEQDPESYF